MDRTKITRSMMLLTAALIWGVAFVAQQVGMETVGPYTFTATRTMIGGVCLFPLVLARSGGQIRKLFTRDALIGGALCGVILALGTNLQQFALMETSVGKAGFLTALYIVIVPLFALALRRPVGPLMWFGVGFALVGLYCLCVTGALRIERVDMLLIACAFVFALHILVIDYYVQRVDGVVLSFLQFWVCSVLSGAMMGAFEAPTWAGLAAAWLPLLYSGVLSSGVGYTLQILGQRDMNPTVASLIMSLESVFSALAGLVLLGQRMTAREVWGCALMFVAIVLAQWPARKVAAPFWGIVVSGKRIGRTMNFPTANLSLAEGGMKPLPGVYAAYAWVGDVRYPAIMNVGRHPTVPDGAPTVEVHLLHFSGDLYGLGLRVEPMRYLRRERKFRSIEQLARQLTLDAQRADALLDG